MNRNIVKPDSAAQLLFDRYDRAGLQIVSSRRASACWMAKSAKSWRERYLKRSPRHAR